MSRKTILLFVLGLICLTVLKSYSQIDPNVPFVNYTYEMKLIMPKALNLNYQTPDILIPIGPFDNYQVSNSNGFAETDIAVNPRNHNNFVGSDNRVTGFSGTPWVYYTTDGGVNWGSVSISSSQGDPVFCADSLGNFYLAVLSNGVRVYKSSDGGLSWVNLGNALNNANADKEWIAADVTAGPYQNNVYIAYVNFATGASVDFWRSTNNGTSWSFVGNMGTGTPNPGPNIAVGPGGRVYLAWYNSTGTSVRVSTDGGASFGGSVTASAHSTPGTLNPIGRFVLKADIRVNGMPQLAVDMSNGPRRGYVYDVYAANPPGPDAASIFCTRSTDGGATWNWSSPVQVNDDPTITDQWMTDVCVDNSGRVWVYWWDSRNDPSNILTETWGAVSTDGGLTFTNFMISNQNFNPNSIRIFQGTQHYYLGDYQGIAGRTVVFPFYTGQNNTLQDFTAYMPDYGILFRKSIDSINPGSNSSVRMVNPVIPPYTGTVTYSASISPSPAPGTLTVTYNPGNVRTFNGNADSVIIQVASTSNVPQNLYTVTITGTESGGPRTHNRSYQIRVGNFSGIKNLNTEVPASFNLSQNYPNPFNPTTNIKFALPVASVVNLKIYDALGREVAALLKNEALHAGNYAYDFDAVSLTSGIYFYKLTAEDFADIKKMVLVK